MTTEPKTHFTSEETRIINLAVRMAAKGFDLSDNPFHTSNALHPIWESGFHAFTRLQKTYSEIHAVSFALRSLA